MKLTLKRNQYCETDFVLQENQNVLGKRDRIALCESGMRGFFGYFPNKLHIYSKNPKKKNTIKCEVNTSYESIHIYGQGNFDVYYSVIAFLKDHNAPKEFYVRWE